MYRFGCNIPGTISMNGKLTFTKDYSILKKCNDYALECGFDYIEVPLGNVMRLSESEVQKAKTELTIRSVNCFLPKYLYTHYNEMVAYAEKAFKRMKELGIETAVFGSGDKRNIRFKFMREKRMAMLKKYLVTIAGFAQENGITITIEPLNYKQTNVINTVTDACDMVRELNVPNLYALGDIYHMAINKEDFNVFQKEIDLIKHIHICEKNRTMPGCAHDSFLDDFFKIIKQTPYDLKMSTEAGIKDFFKEVKVSAELLEKYR